MGRTRRKRQQKKERIIRKRNIQSAVDLDNLKSWILFQSHLFKCGLVPHIFPDTGRGLMTLRDIEAGDNLLELPKQCLITTFTVTKSYIFKIFLTEKMYDATCVLATFLVYEKHLDASSWWKPYIDTLPASYTNPEFCFKSEKNLLPEFAKSHFDLFSRKLKSSYLLIVKSLAKKSDLFCPHCNLSLDKILSYNVFVWGYYTVNTRAVYLNNSNNFEINVKDNNLALAPFLDLFNHVCENVSTASFAIRGDSEFYQVKSRKSYKQGSQVFINYGGHSNLKLYIEYGFIISQNPLDNVTFEMSDLQQFMKLSDNVVHYLNKKKINENMYFSSEGLSYNARNALFVSTTLCHQREWNLKIYCERLDFDDMSKIIFFGSKVLKKKKWELEQSLKKMNNVFCMSESFLFAINLLEEHLRILENCSIYFNKYITINYVNE